MRDCPCPSEHGMCMGRRRFSLSVLEAWNWEKMIDTKEDSKRASA